tara:strand:- start:6604 stop:7830 length:1227 start_codon:yes stop_codon:yes gene_type:complete
MKILIVSQYFWPEHFLINDIAKILVAKGHQVFVLTGKPNYPKGKIFKGYDYFSISDQTINNINVIRVPIIPRFSSYFTLLLNYISFVISAIIFGFWKLKDKKFEAIFVFGNSPIFQAIPAILFAKIFKKPISIWIQDLWPESLSAIKFTSNKYLLNLIKIIVKFIYINVDLILIQSRGFYKKINILSKSTQIKYLPNFYSKESSQLRFNKKYDKFFRKKFIFMFAGNLGKAQSLDTLIDAAYLLRNESDIEFIIIGDGSEKRNLIEKVDKLNLKNIIFIEQQTSNVINSFLQKASALIVTLGDQEVLNLTIPSKIQAYLSSAKPIIASLNGTSSSILRESGAALVVRAGDHIKLKNAILKFTRLSLKERNLMGKKGKIYFENNFSITKFMDNFISFMNLSIQNFNESK